ncbi:hypothetical protein JHL17_07895 [Azospirillum sp. YIM B02556]|uniref:Uncharacterized protein n=1 Tax=Azospirillum endophyticum TaxID=2800326 RepID=A0ABS1F1P0_9PROT|nr:hypothetical protein [Azospirillum endophyticum]MBK1837333.1 hypothetical protein [Azospirillum endophyticum]
MAGRKMVSLPSELWERVEDYRFSQRIRSEAEAIRKLIEHGLSASEASDLGPSPREIEEQAEIERRGGAGWIAHEGMLAGLNGSDPNGCAYTTPLAREVWLKGYIKGQADRLRLSTSEQEAQAVELRTWIAGALHDAGKGGAAFQNMLKPTKK